MSTSTLIALESTPVANPYWASAGIVDARVFTVGNGTLAHGLSHFSPNLVRGLCGITAHVTEREGRLANWADSFPTCPTCIEKTSTRF